MMRIRKLAHTCHIIYYAKLQTNTTTTTSSAIDLTYGGAIKQWMYLAKIDNWTLIRVRSFRNSEEECGTVRRKKVYVIIILLAG